jgi:4-hydroxythreonine-4-phosphate dehydrogenase
MAPTPRRPRIALTLGDPAGIGPEIALGAAREPRVQAAVELVLVGPASLRPADAGSMGGAAWSSTADPEGRWTTGSAQASTGRAAIEALRRGHELALAGDVDALVTAPVSKEALHLAGEPVEGQTELLGRWCGAERFEMLAIAGALRVMLYTRHMPLRRAIEQLSRDGVADHLDLLHAGLVGLGIERPRIALAGLNPHAGERGLLGTEEDEHLVPAVRLARERGLDVEGPVSPDAVFLLAARGRYDGVLALYHDQAFIPIKLLSEDGGVTVLAGLPYLRVSPVHGTAFDIAGRGIASHANLVSALLQAAVWARRRTSFGSGLRTGGAADR